MSRWLEFLQHVSLDGTPPIWSVTLGRASQDSQSAQNSKLKTAFFPSSSTLWTAADAMCCSIDRNLYLLHCWLWPQRTLVRARQWLLGHTSARLYCNTPHMWCILYTCVICDNITTSLKPVWFHVFLADIQYSTAAGPKCPTKSSTVAASVGWAVKHSFTLQRKKKLLSNKMWRTGGSGRLVFTCWVVKAKKSHTPYVCIINLFLQKMINLCYWTVKEARLTNPEWRMCWKLFPVWECGLVLAEQSSAAGRADEDRWS